MWAAIVAVCVTPFLLIACGEGDRPTSRQVQVIRVGIPNPEGDTAGQLRAIRDLVTKLDSTGGPKAPDVLGILEEGTGWRPTPEAVSVEAFDKYLSESRPLVEMCLRFGFTAVARAAGVFESEDAMRVELSPTGAARIHIALFGGEKYEDSGTWRFTENTSLVVIEGLKRALPNGCAGFAGGTYQRDYAQDTLVTPPMQAAGLQLILDRQ